MYIKDVKIGDKIRRIKKHFENINVGDICTVTQIQNNGTVRIKECTYSLDINYFEPVEAALKPFEEWEVGDVVKCLKSVRNEYTAGKNYIITEIDTLYKHIRNYDDSNRLNGWGSKNFEWVERPIKKELPITETKPFKEWKPGDIIRRVGETFEECIKGREYTVNSVAYKNNLMVLELPYIWNSDLFEWISGPKSAVPHNIKVGQTYEYKIGEGFGFFLATVSKIDGDIIHYTLEGGTMSHNVHSSDFLNRYMLTEKIVENSLPQKTKQEIKIGSTWKSKCSNNILSVNEITDTYVFYNWENNNNIGAWKLIDFHNDFEHVSDNTKVTDEKYNHKVTVDSINSAQSTTVPQPKKSIGTMLLNIFIGK